MSNQQEPGPQGTATFRKGDALDLTPAPTGAGRYAPSPTGELHVGNLRTALLAWAFARATDRKFYMRMEDLDRGRYRGVDQQLADLRAFGIDWDGPVVTQSDRLNLYEDALEHLKESGLVFECYCSRKDIREAVSAAHGHPDQYPGTCLHLSGAQRETRRAELAKVGRRPALRLKPSVETWTVHDVLHGNHTGRVDNVVLQRGDGAFAYNLAVAVDDHLMGVDQVVRGEDLLTSAPVHSFLRHAFGGSEPTYVHVPLVLGPQGERLSKRDGAVTLKQLEDAGVGVSQLFQMVASSLGLPEVFDARHFLSVFPTASGRVDWSPWIFKRI